MLEWLAIGALIFAAILAAPLVVLMVLASMPAIFLGAGMLLLVGAAWLADAERWGFAVGLAVPGAILFIGAIRLLVFLTERSAERGSTRRPAAHRTASLQAPRSSPPRQS